MDATEKPVEAALQRLVEATNRHDLDTLVDCFTLDYRNETPAHPARGFLGRDQVRRNWEQIFAVLPDITARVLRHCTQDDTVWSEWEMVGTRPDGSPQQMAGVIIFRAREDRFDRARFYMEPVEAGGIDVNGALRQHLGADSDARTGTAR